MRAIALTLLVAATAASPLAASPEAVQSAPSAVATEHGAAACTGVVPLERLSAADLVAWAAEAGTELMPAPVDLSSPPQCPARISCDPCGQGDGPCFEKAFGSDSCCTSPGGPCFVCPKGTTIYVSTCPCFGDGPSCPRRDQDWYCA